MVANLNELQLNSGFFAKLICRERILDGLNDGTIYVLAGDCSEWNDAIIKVQDYIKQSKVKALWHLPYYIESLSDISLLGNDEGLLAYMDDTEQGCNILMPLYTPDRNYKCYLIGNIDDCSNLDAAFGFLTVDAQKICDECSFAAFVTSIETSPDEAKRIWMQLIDFNSRNLIPEGGQISFKGKYNTSASEYTFFGKGFEKIINIPKIEYADLIRSMKKFPDTIETISKSTDIGLYEGQMEYAKICQNLSGVEKNELILELAKRIKDKKLLAEAIDAVINKAKSSRLKVVLVPKVSEGRIDGRRMHGDWCTYLVDDNDRKQWLDFEPASHVIYIMNLIHRINNPDTPSVVDISKQEKAFVDIYNAIYNGDGKEQYKRLVKNVEKRDGNGFDRKRLSDCYKIITNCINIQCSFFNESPSPYITNLEKPLTIDPKLIEISEKFKKIDSLKWLFLAK